MEQELRLCTVSDDIGVEEVVPPSMNFIFLGAKVQRGGENDMLSYSFCCPTEPPLLFIVLRAKVRSKYLKNVQ